MSSRLILPGRSERVRADIDAGRELHEAAPVVLLRSAKHAARKALHLQHRQL